MPAEQSGADAIEEIAKRLQKPGEPDYHNNMGVAQHGRGNLDDAIREYRKAIRLKPNDGLYHRNLASALADKGEHEEALREYDLALALNWRDYHTHFNHANLLRKLGRIDKAIAEYEQAIKLEPERVEAHYNLADLYWDVQHNFRDASTHYEQALAKESGWHWDTAKVAHLRLGVEYCKDEGWERAEPHLLAVLEREPDNFIANYGLAIVYLNMKADRETESTLRSKALLYANKAIELDKQDEDAIALARTALEAYEKVKPVK